MTNIAVKSIGTYTKICVAVDFKNYIPGEPFRYQMMRNNNFNRRVKLGFVRALVPEWLNTTLNEKRNQTIPTAPNEFIKEMN